MSYNLENTQSIYFERVLSNVFFTISIILRWRQFIIFLKNSLAFNSFLRFKRNVTQCQTKFFIKFKNILKNTNG